MLETANDIVIGIDLGTTNSEVAVVVEGKVVVIDQDSDKMCPSVVGLSDTGALLVGQHAKNQFAAQPDRTIKSVKRLMGTNDVLTLGDRQYTPQMISAIILKNLRIRAQNFLGREIKRCVITVPAYFSDAQRQATREAAEIAGLTIERIINEPTAAALAYEASDNQHKKILVFDLGGGTFDVSIVSMENDIVEVLSSHGNNKLGGDDFDGKLIEHIRKHLAAQGIDIESDRESNRKCLAKIARMAEDIKCVLSDHAFASINEKIAIGSGGSYHLDLEISRLEYEEMINPLIDECMETVQIALEGANMTTRDIDEVILVGGSTRTPIIRSKLQSLFSINPRIEIDPNLCVATGAALQGAIIANQHISTVLVDITPYSFGTSCVEEVNGKPYPFVYAPIIQKNTPLPVTKSEVFYTMEDEQSTIEVNIYQGEDSDALKNIAIGSFRVEGLSRVAANNEIVISLSLDLNGLLTVTATEKYTGLNKSIVIDNAMVSLDEQSIRAARARIDELFKTARDGNITDIDEAEGESDKPLVVENVSMRAKALVEKAEILLADCSNDEDREDLIDSIAIMNDAIKSNEPAKLSEASEELLDLIGYLEAYN